VKRLGLTITLALIGSGHMYASGVIACSGDAGAVNSCYTSHLPSFTTQLDWAIVGSPDGSLYTGVWTANNVLQSGLDVSASGQNLAALNEGIRLAHNIGRVFYGGEWTPAGSTPVPGYYHPGHFQQTSNPSADINTIKADPAVHLLGLALDGATPIDGTLLLNFSSGFDNLGFFASALVDTDFSMRVQVFAGAGGTGLSLSDTTFNFSGSGGTCAAMVNAPPTGCNNAPFIFASAFGNGAQSVILSSSDNRGFYISNLYIYDGSVAVPEPGPMVLSACGLALLLIGSKRMRRKA
jgi:hypothetical protein